MTGKSETEKQRLRNRQAKYRSRHPDRKAARKAEESGAITKKPCRICLAKDGYINMNVEFHHPDHHNPFKGEWLCKTHHEQEDARLDKEHKGG